jgi:hypothetical protein
MACGGADSRERATMPVRPVTVYELAARDFARDSTLTGVVSLISLAIALSPAW